MKKPPFREAGGCTAGISVIDFVQTQFCGIHLQIAKHFIKQHSCRNVRTKFAAKKEAKPQHQLRFYRRDKEFSAG